MRADKNTTSPNVMDMVKRFNQLSRWVASVIVLEENISKRVTLIEAFIKVAVKCKKLQNYNGVFEITTGLQQAAVYRLKKTWEKVKPKMKKKYDNLQLITQTDGNYKLYRQEIANCDFPLVPYLGIFLSDLVYVEESLPDNLEGGFINFTKRTVLAEIFKTITSIQLYSYNFIVEANIQDFLQKLNPLDEEEQFKRSLQIEPRDNDL